MMKENNCDILVHVINFSCKTNFVLAIVNQFIVLDRVRLDSFCDVCVNLFYFFIIVFCSSVF